MRRTVRHLPELAMIDLARQEIAASARLVVVKVGTPGPDASGDGRLNLEQKIEGFSDQLHIVVKPGAESGAGQSSGAVGAGMAVRTHRRPADLAHLQAVAAIGQSILVEAYERALHKHSHHAAQVLLTADDLEHRTRYLNARNTLLTLLELGAVPIINENDTVAVEELHDGVRRQRPPGGDRHEPDPRSDIGAAFRRRGAVRRRPRRADPARNPMVERIDESMLDSSAITLGRIEQGGMTSKLRSGGWPPPAART